MKGPSDLQARQVLRAGWADKDSLERSEKKELRESSESPEKWDLWENGGWWGLWDLWERWDSQERRVVEVEWESLDLLEKREPQVTPGHQVRRGLQDLQDDQALLELQDQAEAEDQKARGGQ